MSNIFSNGINYADADPPTIMPPSITALGYDGWYYKNIAKGRKINWYIPTKPITERDAPPLKVTDLKMFFSTLKIINNVSLPFITIYTAPTGTGDAASWYHARATYIVNQSVAAGSNVCLWVPIGASVPAPSIIGHTNIQLVKDTFSSRGILSPTDTILTIAFGTNSGASAANVEFICNSLNLVTTARDYNFNLSNSNLFTSMKMGFNYMTVSTTDIRQPGNSPAFVVYCPDNCPTAIRKGTTTGTAIIGHASNTNDGVIDNAKMPRLANVAGKSNSSVATDNTNTIFNDFFATVDFKMMTSVAGAQCKIEAWGQDRTTWFKVYADAGTIKAQYSGVDLISKGYVNQGDEIIGANGQATAYGWTTRDCPVTLSLDKWYRMTQIVQFGTTDYTDVVKVELYELTDTGVPTGAPIWSIIDNTWEAYYLLDPEQTPNGNLAPSIDCIQFQCRGAPVNTDIITVKNVMYSSSNNIQVNSIYQLYPNVDGIITYYAGNAVVNPSTILKGNQYALVAKGGFTMEQGFDDIQLNQSSTIYQYDTTGSVQVTFPVALLNSKLGLTKDANYNILSTTFNTVTDEFAVDSITISIAEFIQAVNSASQVVSVGKYSTMYMDFVNYVRTYFGYTGGFASLFNGDSQFEINDGVFDANAFMNLLTGVYDNGKGGYIRDASGSITISNINKLLRYAVDADVFGNRTPNASKTGIASDPNNRSNYGVADGFLPKDIVWVPKGTTITLNLDIDSEVYNPQNNVGVTNAIQYGATQDTQFTSGDFKSTTSATTQKINRVLNAPLLLCLV